MKAYRASATNFSLAHVASRKVRYTVHALLLKLGEYLDFASSRQVARRHTLCHLVNTHRHTHSWCQHRHGSPITSKHYNSVQSSDAYRVFHQVRAQKMHTTHTRTRMLDVCDHFTASHTLHNHSHSSHHNDTNIVNAAASVFDREFCGWVGAHEPPKPMTDCRSRVAMVHSTVTVAVAGCVCVK